MAGEVKVIRAINTPSDRVWTVPNMISGVRIALIPIFAWLLATGIRDEVAFVLAVVIGSSDWLDGFLARRMGQVSRVGKLLDPVADRLAIVALLLALTFRGVVALPITAAILLRELIVTVGFSISEAKGYPRLSVNRVGKVATGLLFCGMGFAVATLVFTEELRAFSLRTSTVLLVAGAVLYWVALWMYGLALLRLTKTAAST